MASIHDGHRERMRNKYFKYGLEQFETHEMLEMLLFFTRQQGNTNPIAHKLLDRFGSLSAVLSAPVDELMKVDGVGEHSAMLISMILPLYRQCLLEKHPLPKKFTSNESIHKFLRAYYINKTEEEVIMILLDNSMRVLKMMKISEGIVNRSAIDFAIISREIVKNNAATVILSHNHPKGFSTPSKQDIMVTVAIRDNLYALGCVFHDHIIVGEKDIFSFSASNEYKGFIDKSKEKPQK